MLLYVGKRDFASITTTDSDWRAAHCVQHTTRQYKYRWISRVRQLFALLERDRGGVQCARAFARVRNTKYIFIGKIQTQILCGRCAAEKERCVCVCNLFGIKWEYYSIYAYMKNLCALGVCTSTAQRPQTQPPLMCECVLLRWSSACAFFL